MHMQLRLLKHLKLYSPEYLAASKINKVTNWENSLIVNNIIKMSSEDLAAWARNVG